MTGKSVRCGMMWGNFRRRAVSTCRMMSASTHPTLLVMTPGDTHERRNSPASRVRWMQNLAKIVIDPDDAPLAAREFPEYEYVANAQGDITETLPKVDDDAIDAVGYGSGVWIRSNL